jgi:hypothetical protein
VYGTRLVQISTELVVIEVVSPFKEMSVQQYSDYTVMSPFQILFNCSAYHPTLCAVDTESFIKQHTKGEEKEEEEIRNYNLSSVRRVDSRLPSM